MAEKAKGEIAAGDAISEEADGQIMENCRKFLHTLPFTLRETGRPPSIFSRGMIGTDFFYKRITLTQSEIWNVGLGKILEPHSRGCCVIQNSK